MKPLNITLRAVARALFAASLAVPVATWAHGDAHPKDGPAQNKAYVATENEVGRSLPPSGDYRTITITMSDAMRFSPAEISVRQGEKIRFVIGNSGKTLHELVLGTRDQLDEHAALMRKFPNMEHDEPHMAHVSPGDEGAIHWQFTNIGEYFYGCLIPGHFEAGMIGKIVVTR